ncbi:MAG: secretin N-terminal domain-containing protein, partial [Burkholderiales bacterium]
MRMFFRCAVLVLSVAGCASQHTRYDTTSTQINAELSAALERKAEAAQAEAVSKALVPPLSVELPKAEEREPRFDLAVNSAPANQVFLAIVSGTRYSMLVNPEVRQPISLNLKDATVFEALNAMRDLYGYEYRAEGTRIFIQPLSLQTRIFQVNYLSGERKGTSDLRVSSTGAVITPNGVGNIGAGVGSGAAVINSGTVGGGGIGSSVDSSKITTSSKTDFWTDLEKSLIAIIGNTEGRNVVVNPQSGLVVVRAMP